jgi:hypothetical protein
MVSLHFIFSYFYRESYLPLLIPHCKGRTKLANMLFAAELQRRLDAEGSQIIVLSLSPGAVSTGEHIMQLVKFKHV